MSQKVILSIGYDEVEVGTVEEVASLLGSECRELVEQSNVAFRIAGYVASIVEELAFNPDYDSETIILEVR